METMRFGDRETYLKWAGSPPAAVPASRMPGQVSSIPIGLVEPHPKLMLRFRYDVDSLAESMSSSVDENTPNGQLNPGRVVPKEDGKGYLVYMGVRRYFALKLLYEKTRDER